MATIFYALPALRRAAPRLSREFFTCHQCLQKAPSRPLQPSLRILGSLRAAGLRFNSTHSSPVNAKTVDLAKSGTPLELLSQTIRPAPPKKFFPETNSKVVAYWLLGSAASVFGIVIFGGLTRLTESGYVQPKDRQFRTAQY
jgi:heme a synthase